VFKCRRFKLVLVAIHLQKLFKYIVLTEAMKIMNYKVKEQTSGVIYDTVDSIIIR